jgi:hypothetical protein
MPLGTVDDAGFFRPSPLFSLLVGAAALVPWLVGVWVIIREVTR